LLQQYAEPRIADMNDIPFDEDARRHEVMKAVLLNSADKIKDTISGDLLGMEKTIISLLHNDQPI